jgi:hypothetical protein
LFAPLTVLVSSSGVAVTSGDGKAAVALKSQPTGRTYYAVRFDGIANKVASSTSTPFSLVIR